MSTHDQPGSTLATKSLTRVLGQSARIKEVMDECADELSSVNTVLWQQLSDDVRLSGVGSALEKSGSVKGKVKDAAEKLSEVNQALADEVRKRQALERQLRTVKARAELARHAAFHDPLTGLPNRVLFNDRLQHGLAQAKRHGWTLAVMFVDLDEFKKINDCYGHDVGDHVLQTMAQRLKGAIRDDDTVCRHGGDEFLSLLMEMGDERDLSAIAEKIISAIEVPCELGTAFASILPPISASIGIAIFPKDGMNAQTLMKRADMAMYNAKRSGTKFSFVR